MKRSDVNPMPEFFDRYIQRVEDIELMDALKKYDNIEQLIGEEKLRALDGLRYEEGKWTVKDIIQHVIDTERIMSYRALRFARWDETILPGYNEDHYAIHAKATKRSFESLLDEWSKVRESSIELFKSFDDIMLVQKGICFNKVMTVLAIGFVVVGHPLHHVHVIQERYYPLLS